MACKMAKNRTQTPRDTGKKMNRTATPRVSNTETAGMKMKKQCTKCKK